jgi:Signal peptidase (SPase) II
VIARLAVAGFVIGDVVADHLIGGRPATYHHSRPYAALLAAIGLSAVAWWSRYKLAPAGRAGMGLTLAGAAGNAASLVTDPAGVSDYLGVQLGHHLLVFNVADVAMASGLALAIVSTVAARRSRGRPGGQSPPRRWTITPPTTVRSATVSASRAGGVASGSSGYTARSPSLPGSSEPSTASSNPAWAPNSV